MSSARSGISVRRCPPAKSLGGGISGKVKLVHTYSDIISLENLCLAWQEFIVGKKKKFDVQKFAKNLMDNIIELHEALVNKTYHHGGYESFFVNDPKRRHIHKASVRDRLLHRAIYCLLYPFFDKTFTADSFSCRLDKGTHKAINRLQTMFYQVSKNNTRTCWVLKCDIRKYFASINHKILLSILREYIPDQEITWLLTNIIESFHTDKATSIGLPLGNLTSQLFANVYMNYFDQWVKHKLKFEQYIRYADDFVFLSTDQNLLKSIIPQVQLFLQTQLKLSLHPTKIMLKTFASGIDFLGWVHFPNYRVLRATAKRRMFAKLRQSPKEEVLQSYLGLISHGNAKKLRQEVLGEYWLWQE